MDIIQLLFILQVSEISMYFDTNIRQNRKNGMIRYEMNENWHDV